MPPYVLERPKVLYNLPTNKYVMWFHVDNPAYGLGMSGVATADTVCGKYEFVNASKPGGFDSHDQTLFQDDDGSAYHVQTVSNRYVAVIQMSQNYLVVQQNVVTTIQQSREGLALFKHEGKYFLLCSQVTWWNPNPAELFVASGALVGATWRSLGNPTSDPKSFYSQPAFVFPFVSAKGVTTWVYAADRWCEPVTLTCSQAWCACLVYATYVWLPMTFNAASGSFNIKWLDSWAPI